MNIFEKLQKLRAAISKIELKQTGLNKYSNYTYFELGDFMPHAINEMEKLKMTSIFFFGKENSSLEVVNIEKPEEKIIFESPSVIPELKGSNALQNIGAAQTYMRRYLYIMALELSDHDQVNTTNPETNDETAEQQRIFNRKINEIELEAFMQAVEETDTKVDMLFKLMKFKGEPADMTFTVWREAMDKIQDKKSKMAKAKEVDLGL